MQGYNKLITIIVPVYNAEKYIAQCIESIIRQTYEKLEIIIIDDGSADNSWEIIRKYAQKDQRFRIRTRENKGSIHTRLEGLGISTGHYIMFCDADDWLDEKAVEEAYVAAESGQADIVKFNMIKEFAEQARSRKIAGAYKTVTVCEKDRFSEQVYPIILNSYFLNSMCSQLIRKESLKIKIEIKEDMQDILMGDDLICNLQIISQAERIIFYPEYYYHYRAAENSITTSISKERAKKNLFDTFRVYSELNHYAALFGKEKEAAQKVIYKKILHEMHMSLKTSVFFHPYSKKERYAFILYAQDLLNTLEKPGSQGAEKLPLLEKLLEKGSMGLYCAMCASSVKWKKILRYSYLKLRGIFKQ